MDGFPDFGPAKAAKSDDWPEPLDFLSDAEITGTPRLRPEHLPEAIAPFVFDTAERLGVDPAAVALAALTSLSSVMSDNWQIQPKAFDTTWTQNPRIWCGLIGDPSTLKTPVIIAATAPIDKLDAAARTEHASAKRQHKIDMKAWKDAGSDPAQEPRVPRLARYLVEGCTTEALQEVLREGDQATMHVPACKVLVRQNEMSEWIATFDKYRSGGTGSADRGAYLRLFDGGRYSIDRVNRGAFATSNWSASILGAIQPGPIQKIAQNTVEDGLFARFLYAVMNYQERGEDRRPDAAAVGRYNALFPALLALQPGGATYGTQQHVVLHADAHRYRIEILDLIDAAGAIPDASSFVKSALGKWPGIWARLTLIFHLIALADARAGQATEALTGRPERIPGPAAASSPGHIYVTLDAAVRASAYMREILLPHLLRADAIMFATAQTGHARWIARYILAKGEARVTARDIVQGYRSLRPPERRRELVDVMSSLEVAAWVRPVFQSDGRPPVAWHVNPKVHATFAARAKQERAERDASKQQIRESLARHFNKQEEL